MTEVNSLSSSVIIPLLDDAIIDGSVDGSEHLILKTRDATNIDAGEILDISALITRLEAIEPNFDTPDFDDQWFDVSSFAGGVTNWGSGYENARYWKKGDIARLSGLVKLPATTSTQTLFTLPSLYRPTSSLIFPMMANMHSGAASTGTAHTHQNYYNGGRLQINSDGTVVAYSGSGLFNADSYVSLDCAIWGLD